MRRDSLSSDQMRVAELVADGLTDQQIAAMIGKSEETVRYNIRRVAHLWQLDPARNVRTQIARRVERVA